MPPIANLVLNLLDKKGTTDMIDVFVKRPLRQQLQFLLLLLTPILWSACTSDQLPEPQGPDCQGEVLTYTEDIRTIIDASCAYSGCHLDTAPGRFDTYEGLLPYVDGDNTLLQRVVIERADPVFGMPPDNAPGGRPTNLTEEEVLMIECWIAAGYPN